MPVLVVDRLQVVDINGKNSVGLVGHRGQDALERTPVEEAGQRVGGGQLLEPLHALFQGRLGAPALQKPADLPAQVGQREQSVIVEQARAV